MFINIGAMFAPFLATWVRNTFVRMQGFEYNAEAPGLCHQFLDGKMAEDVVAGRFTELATTVSNGNVPANLTDFANNYLEAFNTGFHYAFLTAVVAMSISLLPKIIPSKITNGNKNRVHFRFQNNIKMKTK